MDLLLAWLLYPLLLALVCGGLGLLAERLAGTPVTGVLLVPLGLAALIVIATLTTAWSVTAPATTVVVVALAAGGFALSTGRLRRAAPAWPAALAALGVFVLFAAPVVLSGEATFAGYGVLGDTAIQLIGIDRLLEHGRDLGGLPQSTYRAALDGYFSSGYPFGAQVAIGSVRPLTGLDAAWIYQPGLAFLVAAMALCLYELSRQLVRRPALRGAVAFVAAQPALLYGYALQGSVKELGTATLVALLSALTITYARSVGRDPGSIRAGLPLAVAAAGGIATVGFAVAPWLGPVLVAALVLSARAGAAPRRVAAQAGAFALVTALLSLPALSQLGGYFEVTTGVVTAGEEVGNLLGPLDPLQAAGIWISGDYRLSPGGSWLPLSRLLVAVALVAAALGVAWAVRRRAWAVLLYVGSSLLACVVVVAAGSPWADGKAYAIVSPAILLTAMLGVAALLERDLLPRPRLALGGGLLAGAALAGGVLLSNAFAYRDVKLASHDRLAELERIGARDDLRGPLLTVEFEEYAKHFLRRAAPTGVSEAYSPRPIDPAPPGRPGPSFGHPSDLDELALPYVEAFPTLVLRRSPVASRPPSGYRRTWAGRWYELWERDPAAPRVLAHLPLGSERSAGAVPRCEDVRALARTARAAGGRLAWVPRAEQPSLFPTEPAARVTGGWGPDGAQPLFLRTNGEGSVDGSVNVARAGDYELWLGGSFGGDLRVEVDGREVGRIERELSGRGQYAALAGPLRLTAGEHAVRIVREPRSLAPGAAASTIGPLFLTSAADGPEAAVRTLDPSAWRSLCGRSADWVEAIGG